MSSGISQAGSQQLLHFYAGRDNPVCGSLDASLRFTLWEKKQTVAYKKIQKRKGRSLCVLLPHLLINTLTSYSDIALQSAGGFLGKRKAISAEEIKH